MLDLKISCICINPIVFLIFLPLCTHKDVIFFEFIIDKADAAKVSYSTVCGFFFHNFT